MGKWFAATGAALVSLCFACGKNDSMPPPASVAPPSPGAPTGDAGVPVPAADAGPAAPGDDAGTPPAGSTDAGPGGGSGSGGSGGGSGGSGGTDGGSGSGGSADAGVIAAVQVTSGESATALALDPGTVYWTNEIHDVTAPGRFQLRAMPKGGTLAVTRTTARGGEVGGLVFDRGDLYWTMLDCAPPCDYPGAGMERDVFHYDTLAGQLTQMGRGFNELVVDTAFVYAPYAPLGEIHRFERNGSGATVISANGGNAISLTTDGDLIYWARTPPGTQAMEIRSVRKDGTGEGVWLSASPAQIPVYMRWDGAWIFYRDDFGGVGRISTSHTPPAPQILWQAPNGGDLDLKNGRVYWNQSATSQFPGCLGVANLDGTDGHCLDEGQHKYAGVRVDDDFVWFIRDGDVYRLPRQ